MNAKQFAWMYLFEVGHGNVTPSYYGGYDPVRSMKADKKISFSRSYQHACKQEIEEHGIDWEKTDPPKAERYFQFTDTFHDPERVEFLQGELVLKNGQTQTWVAEPKVYNAFEMMADTDRYKEMFKQYK